MDSGNDRSAPVTAPGVSPRSNEEIRADLLALLDELFPLDRDDEPNEADLAAGVEWWARTGIWWGRQCRRAWAQRAALLVEREDQDRRIEELTEVARRVYAAEADVILARAERDALAAERDKLRRDIDAGFQVVRDQRDELRAKVAAAPEVLREHRDFDVFLYDSCYAKCRCGWRAPDRSGFRGDVSPYERVQLDRIDHRVEVVRAALAAASPGDEETT